MRDHHWFTLFSLTFCDQDVTSFWHFIFVALSVCVIKQSINKLSCWCVSSARARPPGPFTEHSLFSLCIFMSFAHPQPPSPPFCLWLSSFTFNAGWGDNTCGVAKFAGVQTAFGAKATQKADPAGDPGWQGGGAAHRLQGDDCNTLAAHSKASNIVCYMHVYTCFWSRQLCQCSSLTLVSDELLPVCL